MTRSKEEAAQDLEPFLPRIYQCVDEALSDYLKQDYASLRNRLTKRSDSSIRNDMIVGKLLAEFESDAEITFIKKYGRYSMLVSNYQIRVKKFDKNFLPNNIYTQAVLDFLTQQNPSSFPGMEPPTNLDLGYMFNNDIETDYGVYFRCPDGLKSCIWHMEIFGSEAEVVRLNNLQTETDLSTERLVQPKREVIEKDKEKPDDPMAN
ncbi:MAG: hypothetical protein HZB44_01645 [Actinobacteria bacterium]|nr:hypothetical protein [Actinomycetota bacterium]